MTPELRTLSDEQFRANRFEMVSRLADDLAHEIKNPLNAIVINLEVLKVRAERGDAASALQRANVIEHETRRLHRLVDRLLQLLRPDRDDLASLSLEQSFDELLPLIEAQTRLARHELLTDCAIPIFVAVRRDVFKFAMLNLIIATHDQLAAGAGTVAVRCGTTDDTVTIRIGAEGTAGAQTAALDHAMDVASALLGPGGGTVIREGAGILVTLPRAATI